MAPSVPPAMAERSTPKTMSSRLMTMKFMQRGAAQAAAEASSPSTPKTEDEGSASKKQKTSHKSAPPTPTANTPIYDQKTIQAALEEEEKKRLTAIERRAAELGDSHWVLDTVNAPPPKPGARPPLKVVQIGFGQIDYTGTFDDDLDTLKTVDISTKTRFHFNMKESKKEKNKHDEGSNSESDFSGDESEEGEVSSDSRDEGDRGGQHHAETTPSNKKRARSSVSARRSEERKKAQEFAEKRRKKEVNLNKLTSISGGGSQAAQKPVFTCHNCRKPGHKAADCPKKRR
ncbi:hypothetical protein QBC34DRAFT_373707 [Podospora aff. communis PSN243]|uniref:CCHC-type domain-containing protein n=1 Tax=Podospora aff. communis PSN243 TaxID=3040156 RepID=A0AAV9H681_9PEZI|nr:hypothetical protein QBC34DRAFT_373707 [Podospora aff. communis PSN243]